MRSLILFGVLAILAVVPMAAQQASSAPTYTLTVVVEGVNTLGGNVGILVFNSSKGWAEDRSAALKDISVPAHEGTNKIEIPGLPAGEYAVSLVHDVNVNHKLDKNFIGMPKEQFGLSNNPHVGLKAPPYTSCTFKLTGNMEVHIKMQ
jgi:uncharacterized protein (DUF2141 family)